MSQLSSLVVRRVSCVARRLIPITLLSFALLATSSAAFAQSLPSGWTSSDVGAPSVAGRASFASSTFTLEGAGIDIWDPSDQFQFAYQQITGDVTIVARLTALENTDALAKAGLMIRESLAGNARHAFAVISSARGLGLLRRATAGGTTASTIVPGTAPAWMRLERRGTTFTVSRSADGSTWTQIASATISMANSVYVGLAVSSHNASTLATATFTGVSVTGGGGGSTLPSGWSASDIGSPAVAGATSSSSSTSFAVSGAGADIWGTSDQFRFAYRQVSGDVDVIARVSTLTGPQAWSKAGVMVRSSLAANSAQASMFVSISKGLAFQRRPGTGLASINTSGGSGTAPMWVKLERRGSALTAFRSSDGNTWTMIGSETLTLPSTFYVGLAVTSHATSSAATANFTNVSVTAPSGPTPTPPTVSLTSPAAGATYTAPASVTIAANASDADNGVAMVEFYANGTLLGTDSSTPYSFNWTNLAAGNYSLTAVARDNSGAVATSAVRNITVSGGTANQPPTVSLTAPASGSTYTAPASFTINATAADPDGTIARVDFYAGTTLLGSDAATPFSFAWSNVSAGSYSLTAVARDNGGLSTTSAARSVIVNNPAPASRAVFSPSPDHASVTRYNLEIFTAGANPSTATPIATQNLGKPAVANNECNVDIAATISGLPSGNYFATLVAISSSGTSPRAVSSNFSR